jgi:hypothetical protein
MVLESLRRMTVIPLFLAALLALPPVAPAVAKDGDDGSLITGRIFAADGTPLVGATLHIYHLASEQVFTSAPTDARGEYTITGLPYGYFDMAVESPDGDFYVGNQVISLEPSGKASLTLTIGPFASDGEQGRAFPGTESVPVGLALVKEKDTGAAGFWKSPKGYAVIGVSALALILLLGSTGSDASPSTP